MKIYLAASDEAVPQLKLYRFRRRVAIKERSRTRGEKALTAKSKKKKSK
jgi:hypothetical protein